MYFNFQTTPTAGTKILNAAFKYHRNVTSQLFGNYTNKNSQICNKVFIQKIFKMKTSGWDTWNEYWRALHGNIRHLQILHQNFPGTTMKHEDISIHIDTIIDKHKPHVLFISELDSDLVKENCPDPYVHVSGKQLNSL